MNTNFCESTIEQCKALHYLLPTSLCWQTHQKWGIMYWRSVWRLYSGLWINWCFLRVQSLEQEPKWAPHRAISMYHNYLADRPGSKAAKKKLMEGRWVKMGKKIWSYGAFISTIWYNVFPKNDNNLTSFYCNKYPREYSTIEAKELIDLDNKYDFPVAVICLQPPQQQPNVYTDHCYFLNTKLGWVYHFT